MKAVITADIINSTKVLDERRNLLPTTLDNIIQELQIICFVKCEMYRGDSFQIVLDDYTKSLKVAILIRLGLIKSNLLNVGKLDARMAIGIGDVVYENDRVALSDGEAFRLSGRTFDNLSKQKILIATSQQSINEQLNILLAFVDDLLKHITVAQSECLYEAILYGKTQSDIAIKLDKKYRQSVAKHLKAAKEDLFKMFLEYTERILINL